MTVDAVALLRGDARPRGLQVMQPPAVVSGALCVQSLSLSHHTIRPGAWVGGCIGPNTGSIRDEDWTGLIQAGAT
jgi:hypothetical protein